MKILVQNTPPRESPGEAGGGGFAMEIAASRTWLLVREVGDEGGLIGGRAILRCRKRPFLERILVFPRPREESEALVEGGGGGTRAVMVV